MWLNRHSNDVFCLKEPHFGLKMKTARACECPALITALVSAGTARQHGGGRTAAAA